MNKMKMMSLFDGSGGFPLAASMCGIEPRYASEVEPYPIAVTRSRFPNMEHLGDVSKVHGWDLEPVDVITFGSPCQDMSIAGKRAGIKHEENGDEETTRSGLFMEAVRIIKEMRKATNGRYPAFAVWENVPGAFSSNKGEDFRLVLKELVQIVEPSADVPGVPKGGWSYYDCWRGDGWSLAYRTFDAQYWGVPQRRRRIYLVLDLRGRRAGEVLFKRKGLRGYFEESGTAGKGTSADAERCTGVCNQAVCIPINTMIATRWNALGRGTGFGIGENGDPQFTISAAHEHAVCVPVVIDDQGGQQITVRDDGISSTLRAEMHGHPPCVVSAGFKGRQGADYGGVGFGIETAPTFVSGMTADVVCAYDARGNGDGKKSSTITGDQENRIIDYTTVVCIQGNTVDRNVQQNGCGVNENKSFTLNAVDRHAVAFRMEAFGQYKEDEVGSDLKARDYKNVTDIVCGVDCRNMNEYLELYPTLQAKPNGGQSLNFSGVVRISYIVRRITPTECCRLQGFPDRWGEINQLDISDEKEVDRWRHIYKTYCIINGLKVSASILSKPDRLKKWHDKLHTDSAEYKMWGNGIALPNALYVMQGIADALSCDYRPQEAA